MVLQKISQLEGDQLEMYLKTNMPNDIESSSLLQLGLTKAVLLEKSDGFKLHSDIDTSLLNNTLVIEIEKFRAKERQPVNFTYKWLV
ncbi:hypothetical protein RRG08_036913 [Elysia crispata]|uniref:Uncharacterized protein n=1 Tax=Elysia crispata TaxID=231223 RepID=A0AAE0ZI61_9GAST|nr:hypothetical protein RRG08_036913 [Elysia crispata]